MKKSQIKVMTSAALAAAVAVPAAAAVPAVTVDAAEVTVEYVAIEVDGTVTVVTYEDLAKQSIKGSGDVYNLLQEGEIVSVGVDENTFVSYEALAKAVITTDDKDTFEILAELILDETALVPVPGDKEAPVLTLDGESTISLENGGELTLPTVTATDNVDEEVEVTSVITDSEGNTVEEIDTTVAGTYTVTYTATDAAGNVSEEEVVTVEVAEAITVDSVSAIDATTLEVTWSNGETTEVTLEEALLDGATTVSFSYDGEEYTDVELSEAYVAPDTEAPVVTVDGLTTDSTVFGSSLTFSVDATDNVDEEVTPVVMFGDEEVDMNEDGTYTVELTEGENTISVKAMDAAGNETEVQDFTVSYDASVTNATEAVVAFEDTSIETFADVATATDAQTSAEEAIALVADEEVQAELQTRVDAQTEANAETLEAVVDAVNAATNQVQLNNALAFFDGVDTDLLVEYDTAIGTADSVEGIQTAINEVNFLDAFVEAAPASATNSNEINQLALNDAFEYAVENELLTNVDLETFFNAYVSNAVALTNDVTSVEEVQTLVIDPAEENLVTSAVSAVETAEAFEGDLAQTATEIETAQDAIDLVPANATDEDGELIKPALQERIDNVQVVYNVKDTDNQIELLAALEAGFDRVNADWIGNYDGSVDANTVAAIQDNIDAVNQTQLLAVVQGAEMTLDSDSVEDARTLVTAFAEDAAEGEIGPKEYALDILELEDAKIAVNEASTNADLKAALESLDELENSLVEKYEGITKDQLVAGLASEAVFTDELDLETVLDSELANYRAEIEAEEVDDKNQASDIQAIISSVNDQFGSFAAFGDEPTTVEASNTAAPTIKVQALEVDGDNDSDYATEDLSVDVTIDGETKTYTAAFSGGVLELSGKSFDLSEVQSTTADVQFDIGEESYQVEVPLEVTSGNINAGESTLVFNNDPAEYVSGDTIEMTVTLQDANGTLVTKDDGTYASTINVDGDTYYRNVTVEDGVATISVPARTAVTSGDVSVKIAGVTITEADVITIEEGTASTLDVAFDDANDEFTLTVSDGVNTLDGYDDDKLVNFEVVDEDGSSVANAIVNADSEGNLVVDFENGVDNQSIALADSIADGEYTVTVTVDGLTDTLTFDETTTP
ncbi:hypothetical protein N780_13485 [Pontibacillus chungwhensis BH030062]|uniref:Pesticidal crystal protein Cry22Aa Ig-like domain-containing protein n=1 Tax=Pontibacillus chungwhensis BH030062 TaxID=1385513 RepID=A0A0A2UWQ7_9BACI|nr:immunoglobulin-like domain-containing protein [Pontibacillus chungwhensis]KGP92732.1 hypothetical protein N780_13485 [Pontibacillus chungwhensis BH030062]